MGYLSTVSSCKLKQNKTGCYVYFNVILSSLEVTAMAIYVALVLKWDGTKRPFHKKFTGIYIGLALTILRLGLSFFALLVFKLKRPRLCYAWCFLEALLILVTLTCLLSEIVEFANPFPYIESVLSFVVRIFGMWLLFYFGLETAAEEKDREWDQGFMIISEEGPSLPLEQPATTTTTQVMALQSTNISTGDFVEASCNHYDEVNEINDKSSE